MALMPVLLPATPDKAVPPRVTVGFVEQLLVAQSPVPKMVMPVGTPLDEWLVSTERMTGAALAGVLTPKSAKAMANGATARAAFRMFVISISPAAVRTALGNIAPEFAAAIFPKWGR